MNIVWMPYPNMRLSAHVLSAALLGRQTAACVRILRLIAGHRDNRTDLYNIGTVAWSSHPEALVLYLDYCVSELNLRGQNRGIPSPRSRVGVKLYQIPAEWSQNDPAVPEWLGVERIHASHRAALLAKDPGWFAQFAWSEPRVRALAWPGTMPRPGDWVMGPEGQLHMVHSMDRRRRPVMLAEGKRFPVERIEFYAERWKRVIVTD